MADYSSLLEPPPYPADRYAVLADRLKAILGTRNDVVFVQAEAILALEAVATSLAAAGPVVVNVVTSPYGSYFGEWMRRGGARVHTVAAEAGRPIAAAEVRSVLDALPHVDVVAIVHAETSSGIVNPLNEVATFVRDRGALLVVDAVASLGGHPLDADDLGIDICVIGPQKALAGPAGVSAVSVSARAWAAISPDLSPSSLSLGYLKASWLDRGRGALPGMPSALEFWALDAALDRLEAETLAARIARHQRAARATRTGLRALGAVLWVERDDEASALATAIRVPLGEAERLASAAHGFGAAASVGFGQAKDWLIRLDHTGARATPQAVLANLTGYARATGARFAAEELRDIISASN